MRRGPGLRRGRGLRERLLRSELEHLRVGDGIEAADAAGSPFGVYLPYAGQPRPLLNVHVRTPGATWWRLASAGVDAAAVFEGLAPGTYEVRVPPEWSRYADVAEGQATVLVQEGAGTTRLDVRLARP